VTTNDNHIRAALQLVARPRYECLFFINYKHTPLRRLPFAVCLSFLQPPRQPHALQTLCHPPSPFGRRRLSHCCTPFFGALTIPQVRAVVAPSDDLILSASRDSTAISWIKSSGSSFSPAYTFRASSRFVNSVAYLKPTTEAPQGEGIYALARLHVSLTAVLHPGYIVAGGQDSIINIWAIGTNRDEPLYTLLGHSDNVCALDVGVDGTIISGSWDKCVPLPPVPSSPS